MTTNESVYGDYGELDQESWLKWQALLTIEQIAVYECLREITNENQGRPTEVDMKVFARHCGVSYGRLVGGMGSGGVLAQLDSLGLISLSDD